MFSGLVAGIFDKDARRDDGLELGFEHGNGIRNPSASIDGLGPRLKTRVILGQKGPLLRVHDDLIFNPVQSNTVSIFIRQNFSQVLIIR